MSLCKSSRWVPESARWLIANGEVNKAHYYLSQCARVNGREQGVDDLKPEVQQFAWVCHFFLLNITKSHFWCLGVVQSHSCRK